MTSEIPTATVITRKIRSEAARLGFAQVGICPAITPDGWSLFQQWLQQGYHGEMHYLEERREAYRHPSGVLDGCRSIVMLALDYPAPTPSPPRQPGHGRVAHYAQGQRDYHDVIHAKLKTLKRAAESWWPTAKWRGVVDTAPLLERDFARLAGLGWIGKNTLLLSKTGGSAFFLAALLVDQTLDYDQPQTTDHCGTCRACLDACPTQAFPQPGLLDARRCISYLTIELRGTIPTDLRKDIGDWVFGCDVCQEVCPWQSKARGTDEDEFQPRSDLESLDLIELFSLDDDAFRERFRKTPLWRSRRSGLLRNAAVVLGNQRLEQAVGALADALREPSTEVRGSAAWALGQIGSPAAKQALANYLPEETDEEVQQEITNALNQIQGV